MKKIMVYGGCCSRDAFNLDNSYSVVDYIARTSIVSMFSSAPKEAFDFSLVSSPFQKRMVEADVNKTAKNILFERIGDGVFFMDFLVERLDLLETPSGGILTRTSELAKIDKIKKIPKRRIIRRFSNEKKNLFENAWRDFYQKAVHCGVEKKIVINKLFLTENIQGGGTFDEAKKVFITDVNNFLSFIYGVVERDIPFDNFIEYPDSVLIANPNHRWGLSPYHFVDEFYKFQLDKLSSFYK